MENLAWFVVALPFCGFLILSLSGRWLARSTITLVGVGSVASSAVLAIAIALALALPMTSAMITTTTPARSQVMWQWLRSGGVAATFGLRVDALALVMTLIVTVVGSLIHLYSSEFMHEEEGYARYFAYMNLFIGAMLVLVLADNLLLLYLGWEGVGLCSYLLIGFWYREPANGRAARKAFIVTRIGDAAMAVALFILVRDVGSLDILEINHAAQANLGTASAITQWAAFLLLAGALGKSAQLPLHTWLPDAMAGPTPVSALIHAATMVTAGVYLIARMHPVFTAAPDALITVGVVGALGLLLAGFGALAQSDIKRVLAYSTMSQVGFMFLALGVGAWWAAIFHLMTHAFFKALLFLAAGAVIESLHHEHNIFRMGGLRHEMKPVYWAFVIGAASLSGVPLVTAGFYSKDAILSSAFASGHVGRWLWAAGLVGVLLTSVYAFRLVFTVFHGRQQLTPERTVGWRMGVPIGVLALLAVVGGLVRTPESLGDVALFSTFVAPVFPSGSQPHTAVVREILLQSASAALSLTGIGYAYYRYAHRRPSEHDIAGLPVIPLAVQRFWRSGFGFDALFDALAVRPLTTSARRLSGDVLDALSRWVAGSMRWGHRLLSATQTGRLRWYATVMVCGVILLVALVRL